jgi:hypothetical protein
MRFAFADFLDQALQLIPLLLMLLFVCLGIGVFVLGSYLHSRPGKVWGNRAQLWKQLLTWQVVTPGFAPPAILEEFTRSRDFIVSSALMGMGLTLVLGVIGNVMLVWALTGTFSGEDGQVFTVVFFLSCLLGYGLGYLSGVWHLRRLTARGLTYADLHPRTLSDYRSNAFLGIAGILIVGVMLLTLVLTPHLGSQVPFELGRGTPLEISVWVLLAVPVVMLVLLLLGEFVMVHIAGLPRLLLTSQPHTAQRADNLLRALTIGTIQGFELVVLGGLGAIQNNLLMAALWQDGFWQLGARPYSSWLDLEFECTLAVLLLGFLLPILSGRIGGTISGWPWRPVRNP